MRGILIAALFALMAPLAAIAADSPGYREGEHYIRLDQPVRPRNPAKIEVVELFSYGCPHCYTFEKPVEAWLRQLPDDVDFWRSPVTWNPLATLQARAYFTAQALRVLDRVHTPFFEALHVNNRSLNSKEAIRKLFVEYGVDAAQFDKTFDSFGVDSQVKQAGARALSYRIEGTPEMVVGGKYRISGRSLGSQAEMLKVADFLIEKERASRAGQ
jgi:thiol:disulfide interchange protein DsbA